MLKVPVWHEVGTIKKTEGSVPSFHIVLFGSDHSISQVTRPYGAHSSVASHNSQQPTRHSTRQYHFSFTSLERRVDPFPRKISLVTKDTQCVLFNQKPSSFALKWRERNSFALRIQKKAQKEVLMSAYFNVTYPVSGSFVSEEEDC